MYKEKIDLQGFETPFDLIRNKYSSRFQIIERRFVKNHHLIVILLMIFRGEVFVTIQNQDGTEEVTHLMPETNRFEDPRCQTSDSADSNNLSWSETGPPWTILGNCS